MNEQDELFSTNQLQLWKLSTWATFASQAVLAIYILFALYQTYRFFTVSNNNPLMFDERARGIISLLVTDPTRIFDLVFSIILYIVQGTVYYLVLQGVALGLNMIVETDINYREKKDGRNG